jgi:hypothetical protein
MAALNTTLNIGLVIKYFNQTSFFVTSLNRFNLYSDKQKRRNQILVQTNFSTLMLHVK